MPLKCQLFHYLLKIKIYQLNRKVKEFYPSSRARSLLLKYKIPPRLRGYSPIAVSRTCRRCLAFPRHFLKVNKN